MEQEPIDSHIRELRTRLKHVFIVFAVLTGIGFYFSSDILGFLQQDLSVGLHALTAYEVLYTQVMIAVLFGLAVSIPVIFIHFLGFMKPGMKEAEYRVLRNYFPFGMFLFIVGSVFSYHFVVKSSLAFFQSMTDASEVSAIWGLQNTLGFALKISFLSAITFQLPLVFLVLGKAGLVTADTMRKYRGYFIVGILLAAAVATPPDILTQVLITFPVIGLYQLSIFLVSRTD